MNKKRLTALALCAALTLSPALAAGEDKFPAINEYPGYADVVEADWYYANAKLCYEIGLMQGTQNGFEPGKTLTVGEVAAVAARMNEALTGEPIPFATPKPGETLPWYFSYVHYLAQRGVAVGDPEKNATRQEFVAMLSAILTAEDLAPINTIAALPDTDSAAVLAFYNAGILTGIDPYGTFAGDRTLMRSECAGMVSRIARSGLRMPFVPADYAPFTAAYCTPDTVFFGNGVTAGAFLPEVCRVIRDWEIEFNGSGADFNWHFEFDGGKTLLEQIREEALAGVGIDPAQVRELQTAAYANFDYQVFYSRLIDLMGGPLGLDRDVA